MEIELPFVLVAALIGLLAAAIAAIVYMIVDATLGVKYYQQFRKAMVKEEQNNNEESKQECEKLELDLGGGN